MLKISLKTIALFAVLALLSGIQTAGAVTTTVASVPDGMMTFPIKHGISNYISLPLTATSIYTSTVSAVTANSIAVDDAPAPFTSSLATATAPYFVKILSGSQSGRVMLITANTATTLTLDITDHNSGSAVALNTTSFNIESGDAFEIFPGDTLGTIFGNNSANNPLILVGSTTVTVADAISLFNTTAAPAIIYFFNTKLGFWVRNGTTLNANNTVIYPYSALAVTRRAKNADTALVLSGRVTQVNAATKVAGRAGVYTSTHYATDIKLSQLSFGSNWTHGDTLAKADALSVWNSTTGRFDVYYQKTDSTWRISTDAKTDRSSFVISAGTVTSITKRTAVLGATSFLLSSMPYSLN